MKAAIENMVRRLREYFINEDVKVSKWDAEMMQDFYSYNLSLCMTAAAMVCIISLIGFIGTYSPFSTGFVIPAINATSVYLAIFCINLLFFAAMYYVSTHSDHISSARYRRLFISFTGINMVLASATFFTTQENSSFFFEYILISIIIYLVPNLDLRSFFRNVVINVISVLAVLTAAKRSVAWQDIVDIVSLFVICGFVNKFRLQSFAQREKEKYFIQRQKDQFYHDSRTDELTHVANRTALRADFSRFLNQPLCVSLIDLDSFKKCNDIYGHVYGDKVLAKTGSYLKHIFHDMNDHCYRYGGDEFLIISENEEAAAFRRRLEAFQKLCETKEDENEISCCIGYYADQPHTEKDLRTMINNADHYLYQAKNEGESRIDGASAEIKEEGSSSASSESTSSAVTPITGRDPLTGLPDMRTFLDSMRQYRRRKRDVSTEGELAVLYFDLINFRMINLLYGMAYGDDTLRRVAESLQKSFPGSIVSHWDVDRYAVLSDTRNLEKRAKDALEKINQVLPLNAECSVGACIWDDPALDASTVCNRAKAASDESRKKIGLHFAWYTRDIGEALTENAYVVSHIDEAIKKGWIVVYYQPVVRALSNQVCGMEALARWKDPERGLLPPVDFIEPLEDARQIHKLDLCVIRQAVEQIADRYRRHLMEIPISINLSRLDFLCCDIYQEIENLVMHYDIPRRMLHIEVTESIMRSEDGAILKALQSFRNAGYELWMDDFGSGYSTLNLLKDYSFDLLKMDMGFLRSDTKRSRDIIISVIEMDKRLGIRTLAEGVETKEQVEFLKKAGCEMLQGYYFSRPLPFEESLQNCLDNGIGVESAQQKICYDALGHVDFMTDVPLLICEAEGGQTQLLFANDIGLRQFRKDGFADLKALEDTLNDSHNVASRELRKALKYADKVNDSGEITSFFNGNRRVVRYQMLGRYDDTHFYVFHIYGRASEDNDQASQNQLLMNLTYFYRNLFSINTKDMTIQSLRFVDLAVTRSNLEPVRDQNGNYASVLPSVFEEDRKKYDAFIDPSTLLTRLEKAEYGILHEAFRTQGADGTYIWMSHRLLLVPNAGRRQILYVIHTMDDKDLSREASAEKGNRDMAYFVSLMRHIPLPVFWKDRERRFLGASQSFMDYYGLSSVNEILGRTDEDMRWHLNNEKFREEENALLQSGKEYRNVPGRCICQGESREIYTTKWPTYQNGRISGLMGYFIDPQKIAADRKEQADDLMKEGRGKDCYMQDLEAYQTDYRLNHRPFGVIYIHVPELIRIAEKFGHATMHSVSKACMQVIRGTLKQTGSCENLDVGFFAVTMALRDGNELKDKAEIIRRGINAIHEVEGIPCSLYAKVRTMNADEIMRLNHQILEMIYPSAAKAEADDNRLALQDGKALLKLLDEIPIGCYILKPDHTVLYWSAEAASLLGFTAAEMQGRKCTDTPLGCSFTTGEKVPNQFCPAVVAYRTGRSSSLQMFMRRKDGSEILVRNVLTPIRDQNGRVTQLLSFFFPLADKDYDATMIRELYETATRDALTCLPGRKYMEACLQDELERFRRTGNLFAVLFADADYLHEINNTYGHEAGDAMLKEIGMMLRKYGRKADRFCRWGGDEFVGLLQLKHPQDIEGAGLRFKAAAEKCEIEVHGRKITCQTAIGITIVRENDDLKSLVDRADRYMFEAKKAGTAQIVTDFNTKNING